MWRNDVYNLWRFVALNDSKISFVAINAVLSRIFCGDLHAFVWRKIVPKLCVLRKKDKIHVPDICLFFSAHKIFGTIFLMYVSWCVLWYCIYYAYNWVDVREVLKKGPFSQSLTTKGSGPPPFVVTWESEIFGPYFNVVVDAIGPETDFTLETNRKRVKEKLLKSTYNP